jgi:hypothetical protein
VALGRGVAIDDDADDRGPRQRTEVATVGAGRRVVADDDDPVVGDVGDPLQQDPVGHSGIGDGDDMTGQRAAAPAHEQAVPRDERRLHAVAGDLDAAGPTGHDRG